MMQGEVSSPEGVTEIKMKLLEFNEGVLQW